MSPGGSRGVTALADQQERSGRIEKPGERTKRRGPEPGRQDLQGVGLEDEIEAPGPLLGRGEQVRLDVPDARVGEPVPTPAQRRRCDVERGHRTTSLGQILGVIAETASNDQAAGAFDAEAAPMMPIA